MSITNTEDKVLVSIVMPAYNAEKFISQAISSVQNQTLQNWQLIVVNDCSQDDTKKIVEEFVSKDKRIQLISNKENQGVARTRNTGFRYCDGQYVALLDCDDIWKEDKLEKQVKLAQNSGADIIYCSYSLIDEEGNPGYKDFIVPETADLNLILKNSVISCSTALLTKEIVEQYQFSTTFYHEDYVYWLTLLRDGKKAAGVVDVLASYRVSASSRASNKYRTALNRWKIYREYLGYSIIKSGTVFLAYAVLGMIKYKKR